LTVWELTLHLVQNIGLVSSRVRGPDGSPAVGALPEGQSAARLLWFRSRGAPNARL